MKRALCALLLALCACAAPEPEEAQASFFAMNTYMTMTAYGADAQAAVDRAQARIEALESFWSVTQEGSDIYAVNHAQGQPVAVHEETAALLSFALDMAEETGGALEPTLYPVLTAWGSRRTRTACRRRRSSPRSWRTWTTRASGCRGRPCSWTRA